MKNCSREFKRVSNATFGRETGGTQRKKERRKFAGIKEMQQLELGGAH